MKINEWLDQYEPFTGIGIILAFGIIAVTQIYVLEVLGYESISHLIAIILIGSGSILAFTRSPMFRHTYGGKQRWR
jgi:hypothetical protein